MHFVSKLYLFYCFNFKKRNIDNYKSLINLAIVHVPLLIWCAVGSSKIVQLVKIISKPDYKSKKLVFLNLDRKISVLLNVYSFT